MTETHKRIANALDFKTVWSENFGLSLSASHSAVKRKGGGFSGAVYYAVCMIAGAVWKYSS